MEGVFCLVRYWPNNVGVIPVAVWGVGPCAMLVMLNCLATMIDGPVSLHRNNKTLFRLIRAVQRARN